MKHKKDKIQKAIEEDELGEITSLEELGVGIANHNYLIETQKGKYVVRVKCNVANSEITPQTGLEFKVLDFLQKRDFFYETPKPIKNFKGDVWRRIEEDFFYVYPFIEGDVVTQPHLTMEMLEEIGKALGDYHMAVMDFPDASREVLPIHGDFSYDNLIWRENKVLGIIDFDGVIIMPREVDLARAIYDNCPISRIYPEENIRNFLKAYQRVCPLGTEEKANLFSGLLLRSAESFRFAAIGNNKMSEQKRVRNLDKSAKRAEYLIKNEKEIKEVLME